MQKMYLALAAMVLSANLSFAANEPAKAKGLTAVQSDSACAAHVPGAALNDYIGRCAKLITSLVDSLDKCKKLLSIPQSAKQRYDAEDYCSVYNLRLVRVQLAAAYNDRAYFLIQCTGTENYNAALGDLARALALMNGKYWLAKRNQAVAYMLLGDHKTAEAKFAGLIADLDELRDSIANGTEPEAMIFVRPTSEAEMRLGRGLALVGMCDYGAGQDELTASEALTRGPIGTDTEIYALSLFGQGLTWKLKAQVERKSVNGNPRSSKQQKAETNRYADTLDETGQRKMDAAEALLSGVAAVVRDRFHIEEISVLATCATPKKQVHS